MPEITQDEYLAKIKKLPPEKREAGARALKNAGYTIAGADFVSPKQPSFLQAAGQAAAETFSHEGLPIAGMTAGGAEGAALGAPLGPLGMAAGAVGGAAIGAMSGRAATSGIEAAESVARGQQAQTPSQVVQGVRQAGQEGAEGEIIGRGTGEALGMAGRAFLPQLEARAPNLVKAVKAALAADILPSPAQVTGSKFLAGAEDVMAKLPFIGGKITEMRAAQERSYDLLRSRVTELQGRETPAAEVGMRSIEDVAHNLDAQLQQREAAVAKLHQDLLATGGPSVAVRQAAEHLEQIRVARTEAAHENVSKTYKALDSLIPDKLNHVPDDNIQKVAEKISKEYERVPSLGEEVPRIKSMADKLKKGPAGQVIENAVDPVVIYTPSGGAAAKVDQAIADRKTYTMKEMMTLRSTLTSMLQQEQMKIGPGQTTDMGRNLIRAIKAVNDDLGSFSDGLPGDLKKGYDIAGAEWKAYKATYANKDMMSLAKIAKENPEDLFHWLIKPGDQSTIQRVKAAVGDAGFAPMRRLFIDALVTGPDGRMLDTVAINQNIAKYGLPTLHQVLTPAQFKDLISSTKVRGMSGFIETAMEKQLRKVITPGQGVTRASEDVVRMVVNGDSNMAKALHSVVGDTGTAPYRREIVKSILGAPNADVLPGVAQTPSALRVGKNLASYDPQFLKNIGFTKAHIAEIEEVDRVKSLLELQPKLAENRSGSGSTLIAKSILGGAAGGLAGGAGLFFHPAATGVALAGTAGTLLTGDILARMYTSSAGRRLLIQGMTEGSVKNVVLASRIAAFVLNAKREEMDEVRKRAGLKPIFSVPGGR